MGQATSGRHRSGRWSCSQGEGGLVARPHTLHAGSARLLLQRWGQVCEPGFHSPWHGHPQPGAPRSSPGMFLRTVWRDAGYGGGGRSREEVRLYHGQHGALVSQEVPFRPGKQAVCSPTTSTARTVTLSWALLLARTPTGLLFAHTSYFSLFRGPWSLGSLTHGTLKHLG